MAGPPETKTVTVIECIPLEDPPAGALDALADKAKTDPEVDEWINDLDRFYLKSDACKP